MADSIQTGNPSLALVMIARDEARAISRCLQSVSPWVDRLLVLDTGSTDDTVAVARASGAEVHHMPWPGCFATARNRALDLADADWSLVLDADEWVVSGGEQLRHRILDLPGPGVLRVDSLVAEGGTTSDWITRLLPRGVRYTGRVHEQPVCAKPRRRVPVVIGHDGYRPEALQVKQGRNRALLQAALQASGGDDPYLLFQLGKDHETYAELPAAALHYGQALQHADPQASYWPQLVVRTMYCLGKSGHLPQALALASDQLGRLERSVDFQFTLGDLCLDAAVAHPAEAVTHWLPLAEAAWLRCLEMGEQVAQDGRVVGRGSHLAAHNLHVIYDGLGDPVRSAQYGQLASQMRLAAAGTLPV